MNEQIKTARVFTCAISHTKTGTEITPEMVQQLLLNTKGVYQVYAIYHDRDNTKTKHWHFLLWTKTPRKISTIANLLNTTENMIVCVHNKPLMLRYLCHLDNSDKEQYTYDKVLTNSKPYADIIKAELTTDKEILLDIKKRGNDAILDYIDVIEPYRLATLQRLCGNDYQKAIQKELELTRDAIKEIIINQKEVIEYLEFAKKEYVQAIETLKDTMPSLANTFTNGFKALCDSIKLLRGNGKK